MLRGSSVIDWYQLDFRDEDDVDRFLRVNEFDPASHDDMARLEELRLDAVEYLTPQLQHGAPGRGRQPGAGPRPVPDGVARGQAADRGPASSSR